MYVFGGYEEIIERFGQDVYRLDLSSYAWKLLVSKLDCQTVHMYTMVTVAVLCWRAAGAQGLPHSHGYWPADDHLRWEE